MNLNEEPLLQSLELVLYNTTKSVELYIVTLTRQDVGDIIWDTDVLSMCMVVDVFITNYEFD